MTTEKFKLYFIIFVLSILLGGMTLKYYSIKKYAQKEVKTKVWCCKEYHKLLGFKKLEFGLDE